MMQQTPWSEVSKEEGRIFKKNKFGEHLLTVAGSMKWNENKWEQQKNTANFEARL